MEIVLPEIIQQDPEQAVNPLLLNNWLLSENIHRTPLEFTLKVWSAYGGDPRGARPVDAIEAYLHRIAPDSKGRLALERLAFQMTSTNQAYINRNKAGSLISEFEIVEPSTSPQPPESLSPDDPGQFENQPANPPGNSSENPSKPAAIQRILPRLIDNGLIVERLTDTVGFVHPVILGYLAGCALQQGGNVIALIAQPSWVGRDLALQYLAAQGDVTPVINHYLNHLEEPLYRNLFIMARWLKDASTARTPWRGIVMRKLADLIQRDLLPMSVRQRALAGLIFSNDPGVNLLFRQFLGSPSNSLRLLGALGCGAIQDQKSIGELGGLLTDVDPRVRYAACLALACLGLMPALEFLETAFKQGDEDLRRAVAEALARYPALGYPILNEAAISADILVRRAAVFGLIQVRQPWANQILDKMRMEDGQWVVRSAAAQAIEVIQKPDRRIPHPLPVPSQSPWLITFAGKQGVGIPEGSQPIDIMLDAFKKGNEEEKLAALDYLIQIPEEGILSAILMAIYTETDHVREAATNTLWWMAVSGATIPSPQQFGFSKAASI
jgi:hypothetical protein